MIIIKLEVLKLFKINAVLVSKKGRKLLSLLRNSSFM